MIPQERKDAFFAQIKYPVFGAAAMSTKMLEHKEHVASLREAATRLYGPAKVN